MTIAVSLIFALLGWIAVCGPWTPTGAMSGLYHFLVAWMYFNRAPARARARWWETALAVGGTFLPLLALRPAPAPRAATAWDQIGTLIQLWGLLGMTWSVFSLGPALGIAPADRGLVTAGPYRHVRHPMYAFEIVSCLGYVVAHRTAANALAWLALVALQVLRARREERVIDGYGRYAARVRWRFIPGVV